MGATLGLVALVVGCAAPTPSAPQSPRPSTLACDVTDPNQGDPPAGDTETVHLGNGTLGTDLWPDGTVIA